MVPGFGPTNGVYVALDSGAHLPGGMRRLSREAKYIEHNYPGLIGELGLKAAKVYLGSRAA